MVAGITTTAVELSSGGETGSVPNTAGPVGICRRGAGRREVERKVLRRNVIAKGVFWLKQSNGMLTEDRPGEQTWRRSGEG